MNNLNETRVYNPEIARSKEPSLQQPTLLDTRDARSGKVNGKLDPRIVAARERAALALQKAKDTNTGIQKSDLDLDVSDREYVETAQAHPLEMDMDKRLPRIIPEGYTGEGSLIAGAGEELQLPRIAEQALKMLGTGLKPSIVATALSVSPGYISQLMSDEKFAKAVTERKIVALTRNNEHDDNLHAVEEMALRKLKTSLEFTNKPMEVARIFSIVNNAKRRGAGNLDDATQEDGRATVTLTLPAAARIKLGLQVEVNDKNQVTTVGNQQLGAIEPKHLMEVYRTGGNLIDSSTGKLITDADKVVARQVNAAHEQADKLNAQVNINEIGLDDL